MVSSAISGISQKSVSTVSSISGRQNSQDSFGTDFSKVMNASLQNKNSGKTGSHNNSFMSASILASGVKNNDSTNQKITSSVNKDKTSSVINNANFNKDLKQAVSDIKEKIKDALNVSDEDIENAMEQLGIGAGDLFNVQNVIDLVIALNGSNDSLEFITNVSDTESLNDIINSVNGIIQNLTDNYNADANDLKEMYAGMNIADNAEDKETFVKNDDSDNVGNEQESLYDVIASKTEVEDQTQQSGEKKDSYGADASDRQNDAIDKITSDMTQSIQKAFSEIVDESSAISETDIVRQVVEQIKVTATQQLSSIEVMLNPENLGKVHVAVTAKQGIVTAQLTAQNEQVKVALENQMTALKEQFNNQGVKVDAVEITVQSHGFESEQNLEGNNSNQAQQEKKSHRKLDLSSLEGLDESDMTSEEIRAKDAIVNGNSSVEYSA